jgi:hypothetical protein
MEKLISPARNTHDMHQVLLGYQTNRQDRGTLAGEDYSLHGIVQNRCLFETFQHGFSQVRRMRWDKHEINRGCSLAMYVR